MSLISKFLHAVRTWRRSRGPKTAKRSPVAVERLDYRRLLSVNFTGNVTTDFPASLSPGVVIFNGSNSVSPITVASSAGTALASLVPTSGYAINEIAVSYDAQDNTLSIGLGSPPANPADPSAGEVIAGDADDNGNAGNVNPAVLTLYPLFTEFPALEGDGIQMGAFLDLTDSGVPDVVAGFSPVQPPLPSNMSPSPAPPAPKPYEVALAIPNSTNPSTEPPAWGTLLPGNTGNVYLFNSPAHPNLEFSITDFSQLYQTVTGHALTSSSVIGVGAFGGSNTDGPISKSFFPENTFTVAQATVPTTNPEPSPPILINPHEHRIIDTHHRDLIRATVFGTSGFPVSEINPATVELDGAHAIAHITRKVHRNEFPFETFVFVGDQVTLPAGLTTATLTGKTYSGVTFSTQKDVLNIPDSARVFGRLRKYMGGGSLYERLVKVEQKHPGIVISSPSSPTAVASPNPAARGTAKIKVDYSPKLTSTAKADKAEEVEVRPVVSIRRDAAPHDAARVPTRVKYSLDHYLSS